MIWGDLKYIILWKKPSMNSKSNIKMNQNESSDNYDYFQIIFRVFFEKLRLIIMIIQDFNS
jgi:hypothetical protein